MQGFSEHLQCEKCSVDSASYLQKEVYLTVKLKLGKEVGCHPVSTVLMWKVQGYYYQDKSYDLHSNPNLVG